MSHSGEGYGAALFGKAPWGMESGRGICKGESGYEVLGRPYSLVPEGCEPSAGERGVTRLVGKRVASIEDPAVKVLPWREKAAADERRAVADLGGEQERAAARGGRPCGGWDRLGQVEAVGREFDRRLPELVREYAGQYVAFDGSEVVSHGMDPAEVRSKALDRIGWRRGHPYPAIVVRRCVDQSGRGENAPAVLRGLAGAWGRKGR